MEGLIPELALGTVSVIAAVIVIVESLKSLGFASDDGPITPPRAAVGTGLALGAVWVASELFPVAAPYIFVATAGVTGGLVAGLVYDVAGEAFLAYIQRVASAVLNRGE